MQTLPAGERIAITGMGMCNALGQHIDILWPRTLAMQSGMTRLQPDSDAPQNFLAAPYVVGHNSYCDVLALCPREFTRQELGVPPQDYRVMSTSTKMTLLTGQQAVEQAALDKAGYPGGRVGVFVSQNAGEAASTLYALEQFVHADALASAAAAHGQWDAATECAFADSLRARSLTPDEGSLLSRLNCTAAGRLCQRYGFSGPSFSVGAACASSMAALYAALPLLRDGTLDAAVVGGGEETYNPLYFIEFCALGALAHPQERFPNPAEYCRPFDAHRTGFVLGEGAAMVVLERESTARARGARILGLITGAGGVTNTTGPVEPSADAQQKAMELSFHGLDYGPTAVELLECHATATRQGDHEEGVALARLCGTSAGGKGAVLSAYKAQIGHTTGASGLMALIHGVLSMGAHVFPGTCNCTEPDPDIPLQSEGLSVPAAPQPWDAPRDGIRRTQVNAFAFGGACFCVQLEEDNTRSLRTHAPTPRDNTPTADASVTGVAGEYDGSQSVVDGVRLVSLTHNNEQWRLGSITPMWMQELGGLPTVPDQDALAALARRGVWLHKSDTPPPVAVMCCGQGSIWPGMGRALYDAFPAARAAMDRIASVANWDVLGLLDEPELEKITLTRWQQPYLFLLEYAQATYLQSLGFTPNVMIGHSLGELIALCLAGVYTPEQSWYILDERAKQMAKLEAAAAHDTCMMAVYAGQEIIDATLQQFPSLRISNYNTPTQFILSGPTEVLQEARRMLRKQKNPAVMLNVSMAFHHPGMRVMREESARRLNEIPTSPARMPMLSNVTTGLYPADTADIVEYIVDLDENAVRWVECVHQMWNTYHVRHFVEMGPADTLCGLTTDIIPEAVCMSAGRKNNEVEGMRSTVARLYALGHLPRRSGHTPAQAPAGTCVMAAPLAADHTADQPAATRPVAGAGASAATPTPPHVEELMPIIMQATGYTRDELAPDMDLRHDLSIRSSRFPVIMHEAEERFGISIRFEDLMGVATIRDLADVLARLRAHQDSAPADADASRTTAAADATEAAAPMPPLLRHMPCCETLLLPLPVTGLDATPVLVVPMPDAAGIHDANLPRQWQECLQFLGAEPQLCDNLAHALTLAQDADAPVPQGIVFCLPENAPCADPGAPLADALLVLQAVLRRNPKIFCCASQYGVTPQSGLASPLMEGLTGLLLSVALEYPSAHCRAVTASHQVDTVWMAQALQRTQDARYVAWFLDAQGQCYTPSLRAVPADATADALPLRRGDVLIISGGGRGITPQALRGLAPLGCTLVLLGRSTMTPEDTLRELSGLGATVRYLPCDTNDSTAVQQCLHTVYTEFGHIDGILHAAGVNRDATLASLSAEDARLVITTKCSGLYHLLTHAAPLGLRYALAFSSLAGWLGNYGQSNYSAANRAMAALLQRWCATQNMPCRCVWLPPIVGAGMAHSHDMREQMRLRGLDNAWIDASELGTLLTRECLAAGQSQVLWTRVLPTLPYIMPPATPSRAAQCGVAERSGRYGTVYPVQLEHGTAPVYTGGHDVSHFIDTDFVCAPPTTESTPAKAPAEASAAAPVDKPAEKNAPEEAPLPPRVGTGLLVHCLAEATQEYLPWGTVLGLRNMRFDAPLLCPQGVTRQSRIRLTDTGLAPLATPLGQVPAHVLRADISAPAISANGRRQAHDDSVCHSEVIAGFVDVAQCTLDIGKISDSTPFCSQRHLYNQEMIAALSKQGYSHFQHWITLALQTLNEHKPLGVPQAIQAYWALPVRAGDVEVSCYYCHSEKNQALCCTIHIVHADGSSLALLEGVTFGSVSA